VAFRRALGLYGFLYAAVHLVIDVGFDRALSLSSTVHEISTRRFLQVGAAAILLMVPLAVTSMNAMIQRMGPKQWKRLHRATYLVAILGVLHYYMLVKSDVRQPLAFEGVLAVLLSYRVGRHYFDRFKAAKPRLRSAARSGRFLTQAAQQELRPPSRGSRKRKDEESNRSSHSRGLRLDRITGCPRRSKQCPGHSAEAIPKAFQRIAGRSSAGQTAGIGTRNLSCIPSEEFSRENHCPGVSRGSPPAIR